MSAQSPDPVTDAAIAIPPHTPASLARLALDFVVMTAAYVALGLAALGGFCLTF